MAIPASVERLGYGGPEGSFAEGSRAPVIQSVGATRTLLAKESRSLCLLDRAAGIVYTLPTPSEGIFFDFMATVSVTTNSYKVITAAGTQFLIGGVMSANLTVAASGDFFVANGTTHVAITSNGTDTGGLVGGIFRVTAISATQWAVTGVIVGSGTNADPFAAS